jgi:hypothetical protein
MKTVNMIITAVTLLALSLTNVHASDRKVGGLLLGGSTGAIVGQAVGRNAQSTIVGATVGGVLGLIIGNEMDRHHGSVTQRSQAVGHSPRYAPRYSPRYDRRQRPVYSDHYRYNQYRHYPRYGNNKTNCKRIVTIEKKHHKTKRVVSTICKNNQRGNYKNHNSYRNDRRTYR